MQTRKQGVVVELFEKDVRQDLGYKKAEPVSRRPQEKWSYEAMRNIKRISPVESPLKQWWLEQKSKKTTETDFEIDFER